MANAMKFGVPVSRCSTLFLTHLHPDHTADLVPFLFARKYAPGAWTEAPPLTIFGPPNTGDFMGHLLRAWPSLDHKKSRVALEVEELPLKGGSVQLPGEVTVTSIPVEHSGMPAFAYRFSKQGRTGQTKVVSFSGDSKLCSGLIEAARDSDLFFCECSCFPRGCEPLQCRDVHLSWEDVNEVCQQANPARVVLTHLYECVLASQPGPLESLSQALAIPVTLAEDGANYQA